MTAYEMSISYWSSGVCSSDLGLRAAKTAVLGPVKVNAVLLRGVNDDQSPELLRWALAEGYHLRFIEQMPLDAQHAWNRDAMITADEIQTRLRSEEHTSELQSLMRISYAVFCLKKKNMTKLIIKSHNYNMRTTQRIQT